MKSKRFKPNPNIGAIERKLRQQARQQQRDSLMQAEAYNSGKREGYRLAKEKFSQEAVRDLGDVWNQVAQFAQASSNYARAISDMYKAKAGISTDGQPVTLEEKK